MSLFVYKLSLPFQAFIVTILDRRERCGATGYSSYSSTKPLWQGLCSALSGTVLEVFVALCSLGMV
jgi:hypothetical protein